MTKMTLSYMQCTDMYYENEPKTTKKYKRVIKCNNNKKTLNEMYMQTETEMKTESKLKPNNDDLFIDEIGAHLINDQTEMEKKKIIFIIGKFIRLYKVKGWWSLVMHFTEIHCQK